jgi:nicotinamidase/pyrazinamidase
MKTRALILVDLQNDFLPGGALAVPDGDQVIPVANLMQERFTLIVATQDWHPPGHGSFASAHPGRQPGDRIDLNGLPQILWPDHCIQRTEGAALAPALRTERIAAVFQKGTDPGVDSYSGFFDNGHRHATGLGDWLSAKGVAEVYILGLATDYCVKLTALDAARLGHVVYLVEDGCRGVDVCPGDVEAAIREMQAAGVTAVRSQDVPMEEG